MKILPVVGIGIAAMAAYLYIAPSIAFRQMRASVAANDVDTFSSQMDSIGIQKHLRNQMSLQMQNALGSYLTRPDSATTEASLAPYFDARSEALVTPASLLRELGSQLKEQSGNVEVAFKDPSDVRVSWISMGQQHEASLSRHQLAWKLSAIDIPDAMPRFWDQPTTLLGTYHRREFDNCCFYGKSLPTPYIELQLSAAMDILGVFPDLDTEGSLSNITEVQVANDPELFSGTNDGQLMEVHCSSLSFGFNGHYALPVYCDADNKYLR